MNTIKLAVIDDGIDDNYIENKLIFLIANETTVSSYHSEKGLTHGTIVAHIIEKTCEINSIISIKILKDQGEQGCSNKLITALEWCLTEGIQIINMSLGTTNLFEREKISQTVSKLYQKGVIMIAAVSNDNKITYPASLNTVIGVSYDWNRELSKNQFAYVENPIDGTDIIVHPNYSFSDLIIANCNSYSAPLVTSKVYQLYTQKASDFKMILNQLKLEICQNNILTPIRNYENPTLENFNIPIVIFKFDIQEKEASFLQQIVDQFVLKEYNCIIFNSRYNMPYKNILNYNMYEEKYHIGIRELIIQSMLKQKIDLILFEDIMNYDIGYILFDKDVDLVLNYNNRILNFYYKNERNILESETMDSQYAYKKHSLRLVVEKIINLLT